jgi:hypothetical protein
MGLKLISPPGGAQRLHSLDHPSSWSGLISPAISPVALAAPTAAASAMFWPIAASAIDWPVSARFERNGCGLSATGADHGRAAAHTTTRTPRASIAAFIC